MKRPWLGVIDCLLLLGLLLGAGLVAAPFVSDAWVTRQNQALLARYDRREQANRQAVLARQYRLLQAEDRRVNARPWQPGMAAAATLADTHRPAKRRDDHRLQAATIARISIPNIGVELPVFADTSDWLLQFGACRLNGTNYPVGRAGDHVVISAHRGVPNATLFTHLPRLHKGDKFYLTVGGHHLAYQIFQRRVIAPGDVAALKRVPHQDLVTLMTCTPYMLNSQRLLLTGRRVPYTAADARRQRQDTWENRLKPWLWGLAALLFGTCYWRVARALIVARRDYRLVLQTAPNATGWLRRGWHGRRRSIAADATGRIDLTVAGGRYRVVVGAQRWQARVRHVQDLALTVR